MSTTKSVVKVVYIGAKPVKQDNVLNRKHLSWPGYGSVQMVPQEDAEVYFRFPAVWCSEEEFEAMQKEKAAATKKPAKGKAAPKDGDNGDGDETGSGEGAGTGEGGTGNDPVGDDRELIVQAAILQLDPKKVGKDGDYTTQGKPRVNRVCEIAGTNVGADEIDYAVKALKHAGKLQ